MKCTRQKTVVEYTQKYLILILKRLVLFCSVTEQVPGHRWKEEKKGEALE